MSNKVKLKDIILKREFCIHGGERNYNCKHSATIPEKKWQKKNHFRIFLIHPNQSHIVVLFVRTFCIKLAVTIRVIFTFKFVTNQDHQWTRHIVQRNRLSLKPWNHVLPASSIFCLLIFGNKHLYLLISVFCDPPFYELETASYILIKEIKSRV